MKAVEIMRRAIPAFLSVLVAACASMPAPFAMNADPVAKDLLTGEWAGSYFGGPEGRSGSILFVLQAGDSAYTVKDGEHAHGDVVMIPAGQTERLRPMNAEEARVGRAPGDPEVLSIDFIRARGVSVSGMMRAYRDPECDCMATASFDGEIAGDVIKGTFQTVRYDGHRQTGTWEVRRRKLGLVP